MNKIAILTSGGDAPGMNACIRACVRKAISKNMQVYGVSRGYKGLLNDDIEEMDRRSVSDVIQRGGTILKTARCLEFKEKEYRLKAFENLKKRGIEGLIVIGGDGSFTGAKSLSDDTGINVVGIPGTIDNDLAYTDYTLGFDTAVNNVLWAINNLRDTSTSHDKISIIKVMGRRCGDIALYSGICGGAEFILVPEIPYDLEDIKNKVVEYKKKGKSSLVLVIAEGVKDEQLIYEEINKINGEEARFITLGYIQRGGSPTMRDRLLASLFAGKAIDCLLEGKTNRVIGVKNDVIIDEDITEALSKKKVFAQNIYDLSLELI